MTQIFGVMVKVILEERCDEVITVIVSLLLPQNDGHLGLETGLDKVIRQKLTIFQELILFTLKGGEMM